MSYKNRDNMKTLIISLLLMLPLISNAQSLEWLTDKNFDQKLHEHDAFGEDEANIVVIEFYAEFNKDNAFKDWAELKEVEFFRVNIADAPNIKKEYRVRMAPTLIIFKNGEKEATFKAGLDLLCPVTLPEIRETIKEIKLSNQF